jgi:superfamily I DNA/RNA helicase
MSWNDNLEENTPVHDFASSEASIIRAVAGPGSGKSFAIGRRIARMIEEGLDPEKILAITFTRTAAKDLKDDISNLTVAGSERVTAQTLHSHALSILMKEQVIEHTGRKPRMILDHEIMPALRDLNNPNFGDINNKKKLKDAYLAAWATLQTDDPGFTQEDNQVLFQGQLIEWMTNHQGMLVGEVISVAIDYLKNNPASDAIGAFDVILVDEYQDLNKAEQEFIRLIRGNASLVIVGDDDQSIYGFKFAHPEGIRTVPEVHGECKDINFEECRRCPTNVTTMASALIEKNPNRTLGPLTPYEQNPEGSIQIIQWADSNRDIVGITEVIKQSFV